MFLLLSGAWTVLGIIVFAVIVQWPLWLLSPEGQDLATIWYFRLWLLVGLYYWFTWYPENVGRKR